MTKILTAEIFNNIPWVTHGFFSRVGTGGDSLDCAFHEGNPSAAQNRQTIIQTLGIKNLATVKQTHSNDAVWVDDMAWSREKAPEADALATALPQMAVGILTADCVPVLFASTKNKIVAASHAGWKGALNGVLSNTVHMMVAQGCDPSDIIAVVGPCICGTSYEVRDDFKKPFIDQSVDNNQFFVAAEKEGHLYFDLPSYAEKQLKDMGLGHVENVKQDTLTQNDTYFSYRRSCLTNDTASRYGRQISAIAIKEGF